MPMTRTPRALGNEAHRGEGRGGVYVAATSPARPAPTARRPVPSAAWRPRSATTPSWPAMSRRRTPRPSRSCCAGSGGDRKAPATADVLMQMVALCPDNMIGGRDRALLVLEFAGAFPSCARCRSRACRRPRLGQGARGCSSTSVPRLFCYGSTVLDPPGRERDPYSDPGCRASALSSRLPRASRHVVFYGQA